jgi:elongation factor P
MPNIQATLLRKGMAIVHEGTLYRVLTFEHRTPGNKRGFIQCKLRNVKDGTQREFKFGSSESVDRVIIESKEMDFLYKDGDGYVFMDTENYEQMTIPGDALGDQAAWLTDGMRIGVEVYDGQAIGIDLPKTVEVTVKETEAVVKGQTAARSNKPAVLENGVRIQVPPFVNQGDRIRVDPGEERYVDRVK